MSGPGLGLAWVQPLWLWALAALAIPLVLHMLSRGQRRRLSVGSVRLLREAASQRSRRLRPTRLLLLAVRCLLLALVAVALAGPLWPTAEPRPDAVWTLIDPALLAARSAWDANPDSPPARAAAALFTRLDEVAAAGAPLRLLEEGLPTSTGARADGLTAGSRRGAAAPRSDLASSDPSSSDLGSSNLWSLVREANAEASAGTRFEIFVLDRLASLTGERPTLGRRVTWHTVVHPGDTRWVERAGPPIEAEDDTAGAGTTLPVSIAHSDASGLRVETRTFALADYPASLPPETVPAPIRPRRPVRAVVANSPDRADDAAFVAAALEAVAERGGPTGDLALTLERWASTADLQAATESPEAIHLLVWLGDLAGLDAALERLAPGAARATIVLTDSQRRYQGCRVRADLPLARGVETITLRRCEEPDPPDDSPDASTTTLWKDALDNPLLSARRVDGPTPHRHYRFHSRFDPAWSDLVTGPAFPAWLAELVSGTAPEPATAPGEAAAPGGELSLTGRPSPRDLRAAVGQGAPRGRPSETVALASKGSSPKLPSPEGSSPNGSMPAPEDRRQPHLPLWAAVAALLAVERLVARR